MVAGEGEKRRLTHKKKRFQIQNKHVFSDHGSASESIKGDIIERLYSDKLFEQFQHENRIGKTRKILIASGRTEMDFGRRFSLVRVIRACSNTFFSGMKKEVLSS